MATFKGTNAADTIRGGSADDLIFGFNGTRTGPSAGRIEAETVASGFSGAVFAGSAPGRPDDLFVVEKNSGAIRLLDPETGARSTFLQIPPAELGSGGEEGLLGLAFHPDYAANGRFFVHLVNSTGNIEIREYVRSAGNPDLADAAPVQTILTVPHPTFSNHNGGALAFGPDDGYLYITLGDGGGANDPNGNGQNPDTLLGSILRLDVDGDDFPADAGRNYAIPDDNPFVGTTGADEVWAWGLRNPWRISFDTNGDLYIADVGQGAREEVNFQPAGSTGGENYGWPLSEGTLGTPPQGAVDPVFEYDHSLGRSITGGHVYHGPGGALKGAYIFADFVTGEVWTLRMKNGEASADAIRTTQITGDGAPLRQIASFGLDGQGALYAVSLGGDIVRLTPKRFAGDLGDVLRGGAGDDRIYGGAGDDRLFGNTDADVLRGGFGDDVLKGGLGRDTLRGDAGDDMLFGGKAADRIIGGAGDDTLRGGAGRDVFVFATGHGDDRIEQFRAGLDLIRIRSGAESFNDLTLTAGADGIEVAFADVTILVAGVGSLDSGDFLF